ncbi:MAG: electron transfer flavoprotein subunit alpha/FixB family protein [Deltaproteobacteria bacterium]|nr:electron transfer flavoprotein subunit alpha/FixB family protein [Deltaproteobacteria bacterium]
MSDAPEIWVVAEADGERWREVSLEALCDAREQADRARGTVAAVTFGPVPQAELERLARYGADRLLCSSGTAAEARSAERCTAVLAGALAQSPKLVLFGDTALGRDIASRLAAAHSLGFASHCNWVRLTPDGSAVEAARLVYGGKLYARVRIRSTPALASLRPGAAGVGKPAPRALQVTPLPPLASAATRVEHLEFVTADPRTVDITEAERIVAVGRGIGSHQQLALYQRLADQLAASLAASRPLVDAGWLEAERQVGQTGRIVGPRLYLAAGISGASHHTLGMKSSECVVAINRDKNAEIFKLADLKVATDLNTLMPVLLEKLEARRSP